VDLHDLEISRELTFAGWVGILSMAHCIRHILSMVYKYSVWLLNMAHWYYVYTRENCYKIH